MAVFNFYLKKPGKAGDSLIVYSFSFNGRRLVSTTGQRIDPKNWSDTKSQMKPAVPGALEFNRHLESLKEAILRLYHGLSANGRIPSPDELKEALRNEIAPEESKQFLIPAMEEFIRENSMLKQPNTVKTYRTTLHHLRQYEVYAGLRRTDLSQVDEKFYTRFVTFLQTRQNLSLNSVGRCIKILKTLLKYANRRGWITRESFPEFKVMQEETQAIYLSEEEIQTLYTLDLSQHPHLERTRDLFLIGCFTGLRFSDFNQIQSENIMGDFLKVKTEKTGQNVVVPVHAVVRTMLNKYEGKLPRAISNQKMNDNLKEIGKMAGMDSRQTKTQTRAGKKTSEFLSKFEMITTHTARRSFATNLYKTGFPTLDIMKITGHRTETSFMKYIKIEREEVATRLLNHWRKSETPFIKIG